MYAYLIDNPPKRSQFAARTNWSKSKITGCTVLHSSESPAGSTVADLAAFIQRRSDPGSYHDIADVHGGALTLVPYHLGAFHDGTGSNGWATSISFNLRTVDWRRLTPTQRRNILRAGARKFAEQQAWRKANGHPLTELRRINRAQSEAGWSGFITHGDRDPDRRSDPGADFPWDEWFDCCREALGGDEEDEVTEQDKQDIAELVVTKLQRSDNSPLPGDQPKQAMDSQVWTGMRRVEEKLDALLAGLKIEPPPAE